jgi:hypothetical protein
MALPEFGPHNMTATGLPVPFVAAASSFFAGLDPWKAFDGQAGPSNNYWIGTGSAVDWLRIDIGTGRSKLCGRYDVQVNNVPEPARAPKNWTFEGSNDASAWTVLHTVTNQTGWASNETRSFTPTVQTTAYRYFRINITANNGDATYTQIQELFLFQAVAPGLIEFAPHTMTASTQGGYTVSASSDFGGGFEAWRAFDGTVFGVLKTWYGVGSGVDWLRIQVPSAYTLDSYTIVVNAVSGELNRAPKAWTMEGSNNGTTWSTLDTVSNQTGWIVGEPRDFTCDVRTTGYTYFRVNITANNGDVTFTQIGELYLYGTAGTVQVQQPMVTIA